MPMEVFTISGPNLGDFGAASSAAQLQNALKALGDAHGGDPLLSGLSVDGKLGPKTVAALNYALKTYIGAAPLVDYHLGGRFTNGTATLSDIQQYTGTLVTMVTRTVKLQGGTVTDPVVKPKGGGKSNPFATSAPTSNAADNTMNNPNLVWLLGGGALVVVALGFMAAHKRAA